MYSENYNQKNLVEMFTDLINWQKRRDGENGFLLNTLKKFKCQKILDAASGDGADSVYLIKEGFEVTSNDIDELFLKKAKENANKEKIDLKTILCDWRDIDKQFKKETFDAVLCLGSSLVYLFKKEDQLKALKNFFSILKKGGILLIDERNYQYILDNRKQITKGKFRYSGKYVYCGNKVHGLPVEISEDKVKMEYTDERTGKKAYLVVYPFKRNELFMLLEKAGFSKIERFSDYKKDFNANADFYQYVCIK